VISNLPYADVAEAVEMRVDQLALQSDEPGRLTRLFGGQAILRAGAMVADWMHEAGLIVRRDIAGNIIGRSRGGTRSSGTWVIGSHIDTVPDAGRYDGVLGVLIGIAVADTFGSENLPFALEVVAFADEEGARFGTSYLGSRAYRDGLIAPDDLRRVDRDGITLRGALDAIDDDALPPADSSGCPDDVVGYLEVHIEQGPILDDRHLPLGVVRGIRGQATGGVEFFGQARHAGTEPMSGRRDALCAAAELIGWVESLGQTTPGLVATVGEISVQPGARNVIPGHGQVSIDMRHADSAKLGDAVSRLNLQAAEIGAGRGLDVRTGVSIVQAPVHCATELSAALADSARAIGHEPLSLDSGAGHDAAILAQRTRIAMLFVRCKDGVSHHPDESVSADDIRAAISCAAEFLLRAGRMESSTT
jgi:allantoate deiminase